MCPGWTQEILEPRVGVEPTTCRLRIGCSTTELPRPAQTTIASAENYCQFGGRDGLLSTRKRIHRPADAYSNQKEEEQRPDNVFYTLDRLPPAQEPERDRDHQREEQHRLQMSELESRSYVHALRPRAASYA